MGAEDPTPRSRRAVLVAAAGAAGALAAGAALPLTTLAADPDDVVKGVDNATTATTSLTDSGAGSTAFAANATGTGGGHGVAGTSASGAGLLGWSVSPPGDWFGPENAAYTGVFGSAPTHPEPGFAAAGVWGDSVDFGVIGTGGTGVYGFGGTGVDGVANNLAGSIGVRAEAPTTSQIALRVDGKVQFSRSGRQAMLSGTKVKTRTLAGVTATSKVFAVLATSEPGRWVRAVVPASGKFTIYLNTTLTSSAVVSWFVLD